MYKQLKNLILCCREENDICIILKNEGYECKRFDKLDDALENANEGMGLMVLSDDYPIQKLVVDNRILDVCKEKKLKVYFEYPMKFEGYDLNEPVKTGYERLAVSSGFFGEKLEELCVMMLNGCWYLPVENVVPHLCMAKVAGYDKAVFGLPEKIHPILFQSEKDPDIMVCTSCLSRVITARYAPVKRWKGLWEHLLYWISSGEFTGELSWKSTVGPTYGPDDKLPADIELKAMKRIYGWMRNYAIYSVDWKKGAIEGYESAIDHMGRQKIRNIVRGDCVAEVGMSMALDWNISKDPDKKDLSGAILDYVLSSPDFFQDDPNTPMYGLNNWYVNGPVFYGDDNARVVMATLVAAAMLNESRWDEKTLKNLLANLRTTNKLGFRHNRLDSRSFANGENWTYYAYEDTKVSYAPHYQAYLWAAFLWAYELTGYEEFLVKPRNALKMCMEVYPDGWTWTNSLTDEIANILLPLAFLVKVDDTPQHREWLTRIVEDLLEHMDETGAIKDAFGDISKGKYPPPQSNESYGTTEASIIQDGSEPATDLMYTTAYAFLGLHEAAEVLKDIKIKAAEDKLAEFLCRIQVSSDEHKYLDGVWMRCFDYEKWEYWGSSADIGWGAWCVESGWLNSWIPCVFALRREGKSIIDLADSDRFKKIIDDLAEEMFTERTVKFNGEKGFVSTMPGAE